MAWLFGSDASDNINCGTTVTRATTAFSVAVRLTVTNAETSFRRYVCYANAAGTEVNCNLGFNATTTNQVSFNFVRDGGGVPNLTWTSGFTAGTTHTLVGTYDGATMRLYADTDTTAKATLAETGTPFSTSTLTFVIGNRTGSANSADSTLYEVAWWPTTTLSGQQAASFGAGFDALTLRPLPTNHWRLNEGSGTTAIDGLGGKHGTVTGATIAAHTVKLYSPESATRYAAAVSLFTSSLGARRTLSELGTRMGTRQLQEEVY